MSSDLNRPQSWARALPARVQILIVVVLVFAAGAGVWVAKSRTNSDVRDPERAALYRDQRSSFNETFQALEPLLYRRGP